MNVLRVISVIFLLTACNQKSKHEELNGDWKVTSWKMKSTYNGYKEKEMLDGNMHVIFEKDSLYLIENNQMESFKYLLKGDTIFVPKDKFGFYLIKTINDEEIHLYKEINATFLSEDKKDKKLHSEINIKLRRN